MAKFVGGSLIIDFEDEVATATPPFRFNPGALTQTPYINRGGSRFDIVTNIKGETKTLDFGQRSLDPFYDDSDSTPFTIDLGVPSGERGVSLYNFVSITMGDYGEDTDYLSIRLFGNEGKLIGGIEDILSPTADDRFTSKTLRVGSQEGERIRTIQFIGRSSVDGSNSVYYDNITLTAVPSANDKLTKPNPYLAENIANSIVEQILKQSLEGGGVHLLDELAGRGKAWRDAAAAAGNAIHDGINEAIHSPFA